MVKEAKARMSTARGVALLRAVEMSRPVSERICSDPYAHSFVEPASVRATRLALSSGLYRLLGSEGFLNYAIGREQYVHDLMVEKLREGLDQIVILGAGFDTRAYRIPEARSIRVFGVDHPITQSAKLDDLRDVIDPFPVHVAFIAVDFDKDSLGEKLRAAGYREDGRTLFVWQGVTMYLTPEGVDRTLEFIANHSGPGSSVVFDYVYRDPGKGIRWPASVTFILRAMGEPATYGIPNGEIVPFLESRGFADVRNIEAADLKSLYFTGPNAGRPLAGTVAIATGSVRHRSGSEL